MNQDDMQTNSKPSLFERFKGLFVFDDNKTQASQEPILQEETPAVSIPTQQMPPILDPAPAPTPVNDLNNAPVTNVSGDINSLAPSAPAPFGSKLNAEEPFENINPQTPPVNEPVAEPISALGPMPTFGINPNPQITEPAPAPVTEAPTPVAKATLEIPTTQPETAPTDINPGPMPTFGIDSTPAPLEQPATITTEPITTSIDTSPQAPTDIPITFK